MISPTAKPRATAFTLVELLVVIAIIGLLVALLLPAVQSARESARRTECLSKIKQLALATINYESAERRLPPCGLLKPVTKFYSPREYEAVDQLYGNMHSWIVLILPYLDETALYDSFDLGRSVTDQPGDPQATALASLLCPSDDAQTDLFAHEFTDGRPFAKGNYAAYTTPFHNDLQMLYPGPLVARPHALARISDGLSETMVISEVRTFPSDQDERGVWALAWNAASLLAMDMHHDRQATGGWYTDFFAQRSFIYQVQTPNQDGANFDILVECPDDVLADAQLAGMPCRQWIGSDLKKGEEGDEPTTNNRIGMFGFQSAAPRSLHLGGVNAAYLDGRAEFLNNDIDPVIMSLAIGIHDGAHGMQAMRDQDASQ